MEESNKEIQEETVAESAEVAEVTETESVEVAENEMPIEGVIEEAKPKQKMNLPNKLSLLRIALVPVMVVLFYMLKPITILLATLVFIIASITDFLDGHIARKHNLVTDFGKFIDPIADKLLVVTALVLIMSSGIISTITGISYVAEISLIIVIAREFAISGLRLVAANNGTVIAADKLGKLKTVTQIIAIIVLFLTFALYVTVYFASAMGMQITNSVVTLVKIMGYAGTGIYIISTLICIISGISYLVKNKEAFMLSK